MELGAGVFDSLLNIHKEEAAVTRSEKVRQRGQDEGSTTKIKIKK